MVTMIMIMIKMMVMMMMAMTMKFTMSGGNKAEHDSFVECKSLSLLHLYPLLVQTLKSLIHDFS